MSRAALMLLTLAVVLPAQSRQPLSVFAGVVRSFTKDVLVIETADFRILDFRLSAGAKASRQGKDIRPADIRTGDQVRIEARQDEHGYLFAVRIDVTGAAPPAPAPPEEPEAPAVPATRAEPAPPPRDPEDTGPPRLRRGIPERVKTARTRAAEPSPPANEVPPPPPEPPDPRIEKIRAETAEFTGTLPDYIVQQYTTSYLSETRKANWQAVGTIYAEVVYTKGKEEYRDLKFNNKPFRKPMEELPVSHSFGEFGTTLSNLLEPFTDARFRFRGDSRSAGRQAWLYDYEVERPRSRWTVRYGSHMCMPAYKGSLWIDKETARVLRIEMQARNLPDEFPLDHVEWVVEYDYIRLGANRFLLPVTAENLGCWRGTTKCSHNRIEFRNYRKFTAESFIYHTESTIDFEKKPVPKPK